MDNSKAILKNLKTHTNALKQVVFSGIPTRYPYETDVTVTYTQNGNWKRNSSDWIGLFEENNSGVGDYVTYVWSGIPGVAAPQDDEEATEVFNCSVTFQAYYLPKTDSSNSHYFAYVTKQGNIRGKSSSFKFGDEDKAVTSSGESESDGEIVVVENDYANYEKLRDEIEILRKEKAIVDESCQDQQNALESTVSQLQKATETIEALHASLKQQKEKEVTYLEERINSNNVEKDLLLVKEENDVLRSQFKDMQLGHGHMMQINDFLNEEHYKRLEELEIAKAELRDADQKIKDLRKAYVKQCENESKIVEEKLKMESELMEEINDLKKSLNTRTASELEEYQSMKREMAATADRESNLQKLLDGAMEALELEKTTTSHLSEDSLKNIIVDLKAERASLRLELSQVEKKWKESKNKESELRKSLDHVEGITQALIKEKNAEKRNYDSLLKDTKNEIDKLKRELCIASRRKKSQNRISPASLRHRRSPGKVSSVHQINNSAENKPLNHDSSVNNSGSDSEIDFVSSDSESYSFDPRNRTKLGSAINSSTEVNFIDVKTWLQAVASH